MLLVEDLSQVTVMPQCSAEWYCKAAASTGFRRQHSNTRPEQDISKQPGRAQPTRSAAERSCSSGKVWGHTHRAPSSAKLEGNATISEDWREKGITLARIGPAVEAYFPIACASLFREAQLAHVVTTGIGLLIWAAGEVSPAGTAGSNMYCVRHKITVWG